MQIVCDAPEYDADLIRLNERWIVEHFALEPMDRELARDPSRIRRDGGHTFAALEHGAPIGVAALFQLAPDHFELARMAVGPAHQGRGVGRALALAALQRAAARGARLVSLLSNTELTRAVALYRSLGFRETSVGQHPRYARCNIVMQVTLTAGA